MALFRGVPADVFERRVKDLFLEVRKAWNDVPFEVVNDGEVTALAGSIALKKNAVVGIALGTSTAGGYVTADGEAISLKANVELPAEAILALDHGANGIGHSLPGGR